MKNEGFWRPLGPLVGHQKFIKGIGLYAEKFDGCAATTDDLIQCIVEGGMMKHGRRYFDIEQFCQWYYQSGTPNVSIRREWEPSL